MSDELESRLRAELQGAVTPPEWVYDRVAAKVRETRQARRTALPTRRLATIAAVLVAAALAVSGPRLYGTLTGPDGTASPETPTTPPTSTPGPTSTSAPAATPLPVPSGDPAASFVLRGTAWRLLQLPGFALTDDTAPTLEFEIANAEQAHVFTGCGHVGLSGTFADGRIADLVLGQLDPSCRAVETANAFVAALGEVTSWAVWVRAPDGSDRFILSGPGGSLQFERLAPTEGSSRELLDTLREGHWRIATATGVRNPAGFGAVLFGDRQFWVQGRCSVAGTYAFRGPNGEMTLEGGFDTIGCGPGDERIELVTVMNAVTEGRLDASGTVHLAGSAGEVVLAREVPSASATPAPTVTTAVAHPLAVTFTSAQAGVMAADVAEAAGTTAGLYRSTDGGRTWTRTYRAAGSIQDVTSLPGTGHVWAVLGCLDPSPACNVLLHSPDGGATWAPTPTPWILNVSFMDANRGWAVFTADGSSIETLRWTIDGGVTWTDAPAQPCAAFPGWFLRDVALTSTAGLAVCGGLGDDRSFPKAVLRTSDDGATWTVTASTGDPSNPAVRPAGAIELAGAADDIGATADGSAWFTGPWALLSRSLDGGVTWASAGLGDRDSRAVTSAWFLDRQRGWAIVWDEHAAFAELQATADGGKIWTEVTRWQIDT